MWTTRNYPTVCGQPQRSARACCDSSGMGIRYYAWAIDDEDIEWMAEYPCACECRDPRPERREALRRLDVLALDKAW